MFVWFFLNRSSGNSLYELMGLEKAATHEEIKKAYRRVGILKKHIYIYIYKHVHINALDMLDLGLWKFNNNYIS